MVQYGSDYYYYRDEAIPLDPAIYADQKRYLIFSWQNDSFGGEQPPAVIDDILLVAKNPWIEDKTLMDFIL